MSISKNTIFTLSKYLSQNPSVPTEVSRVCFSTSASRYSEGRRNAADDDKKGEYSPYNADEAVEEPGDITSSDKTRDAMKETMDKTKEYTQNAKEKTEDATGTVADKTKGAADMMSEKAKETMEGVLGATKQTAQKMKETVVGKSSPDDDVEDFIEDHVRKPAREGKEKVMDEDVVDMRRRCGEEKEQ